jgi:prepilin signal peptidase PulO-like enzyme (type II secretory pathway)
MEVLVMGIIILFSAFVGAILSIFVYKAMPSKTCPKCGHDVKLTDNVGKCAYCKTRFIVDKTTNEVKEVL